MPQENLCSSLWLKSHLLPSPLTKSNFVFFLEAVIKKKFKKKVLQIRFYGNFLWMNNYVYFCEQ